MPEFPPMTAGARAPSPLVPAIVAGALLMENLDATVLNTVTRTIASDFDVSPLRLKFALTAYLLSVSVGIPISGHLADRFGARRVFTLALWLFLLGSLLCGLSQNLLALVLARLLQGAGGALMVPVARLVLLRSYPKEALVHITTLTAMPALLGPAIGPLVGGVLATYVHWRAAFFVNVPLCCFGLWAARRALPADHPSGTLPVDPIAFVSFAAALGGLSFAFECVGDPLLSPAHQWLLWSAALFALAAFAAYTRVVGENFLQLSLFANRTFRLGVLGNCVSRLGVGGTPFLLPLMLQMRFGYTPLQAAFHITPLSVGMLAARSAVSPLLRTLGFRKLLVGNTVLLGVSLASLAAIGAHTPATAQVALVLVYGMFASVHFACMNVLAYVDIDEAHMGAATSIVSTVHTFAMGAGVALGAFLVGAFMHFDAHLPGGAAYAFHRTFALLGVATAASAMLFWRLREHDGDAVSGYHMGRAKARRPA